MSCIIKICQNYKKNIHNYIILAQSQNVFTSTKPPLQLFTVPHLKKNSVNGSMHDDKKMLKLGGKKG